MIARLQALVVLPSDGRAEVMTTAFGGSSTSTYCRLVRTVRKPSARTEVWLSATSGEVCASVSKLTSPRLVLPVSWARSDSL